jgi:hypothetical protein
MTNCENCNNQINGYFCSNCGQTAKLKRIDKHYISHELLHLLHFEKGFFFNVRELLTRPGLSIKEFLHKNRNRHMKPVPFLILTALLSTLVLHFTHADKIYNDQFEILNGKTKIYDIFNWIQRNRGYGNLIHGMFVALSVNIFYRKFKYSFFEIIVLICFVIAQATFLSTITTIFFGLFNPKITLMISGILNLGYSTWAIGHFFDNLKILGFIKSFFVIIVGFLMTFTTITILGLTADFIIKTMSH